MTRQGERSAVLAGLTAAALAMGLGCRPQKPRPAVPAPRANILFVVIDTLRADHLGCYGYPRATSPRIDALGREAVVFEQAYSHSPWTMPSVASMFTSLEPREHGITDWRQRLEESYVTLAEHLRAHGYRTLAYVANGGLARAFRFDQGFDVYDLSVLDGKGLPREISTAKELTDAALKALGPPIRQPFFLWVHYFDPHDFYLRHEELDFGPAPVDRYDSEIAYTDRHLGRLLDGIRRLGLLDKTIVVLVADHGEEFRDHRGLFHTKTLYEELIRIPLIIRVPGFLPARLRPTVVETDLAPTLLSLVGLPLPPQFRGRPIPWTETFRPRDDRTLVAETRRLADKRAIREGRFKLIHDRARRIRELFDLREDPRESRNLAEERPDVLERLQMRLNQQYRTETIAEPHTLPAEVEEVLKGLGYVQ